MCKVRVCPVPSDLLHMHNRTNRRLSLLFLLPLTALFVGLGLACGSHNGGPPLASPFSVASPVMVVSPVANQILAQPTAPAPSETTEASSVANLIRSTTFIWPYNGRITSYFGPGHPLGIDIAIEQGEIAPIRASGAGTVEFRDDATSIDD